MWALLPEGRVGDNNLEGEGGLYCTCDVEHDVGS